MATTVYSTIVISLSSVRGTIQNSAIAGGIALTPSIQASLTSSAIQGNISLSLINTRPADWPDSGNVSAWELETEEFAFAPGINFTVPMISFQATGQDDPLGSLVFSIPEPTLSLYGLDSVNGILSLSIPRHLFSASGNINENATLSITIPVINALFTCLNGVSGTLSLPIPAIRWSASGNLSTEGTMAITLPILSLLFNSLPVSYHNMVMNLRNTALTNFDNYDFNSMCRFNGVNLGASASSIFNLDSGTNDNGTEIEWNFRTMYLDLHQKIKKGLRHAWISYKSSGNLIFTVIQPNGESYEYPLEGVEITEDGIRVKVGKGIRSKYIALDIKNVDGSSVTLDTMKLIFEKILKER